MPSGPAAYVLKKLYGIPYVIYLGGSDVPGIDRDRYGVIYDIITPFVKLIWRGSYETVAASRGLIDFAKKADSKAKFTMIPNGVDLERFKPKKKKKTTKVKILFIGRLIRRKGLHYLIEALPKVLEKANKEIKVEVVGTGPERKNLDALARKLNVKDNIKYVGAIPYEKLHESYQGADVFVLPSTGEGMPCVVLEAMGCGLPIVASDVPGNEEIVVEGRNGFIFKPWDPDELADALVKIINDDKLRQKMSAQSSELSHKYSWASIAACYHRLYKSMVSK
jgi:glycosyltransferase involved in cell wall biosynthesis